MLISDSEKARAAFYEEVLRAPAASPEKASGLVANFEQSIVQRTETEIGVKFKQGLIIAITAIFIASVIVMWVTLYMIYTDEVLLLKASTLKPGDRIIDSKVVSTLIGATVVEIAVAFAMIARYLFTRPSVAAPGSASNP